MSKPLQHLINHIAFAVDASGSMRTLEQTVVEVFDRELETLKKQSQDLNQETRISIYLFGVMGAESIVCLVHDMDVMRFSSLKGHYRTEDMTPLIQAADLALGDFETVSTKYGDHAFLLYVLTDGGENHSSAASKQSFIKRVPNLPDNYTLAFMVPNQLGRAHLERLGVPRDAISIWDTTEQGLKDQGTVMTQSIGTYMVNRSYGIRGTSSFFKQVNANTVTRQEVKANLTEVSPSSYTIIINDAPKTVQIGPLVLAKTKLKKYIKGNSYYDLIKKETIQAGKDIMIQDKKNGKVYAGREAYDLLNLSYGLECKVKPGDFGQWKIFIQSKADNRNILPNQQVLVKL